MFPHLSFKPLSLSSNTRQAPRLGLADPSSGGFDSASHSNIAPTRVASRSRWSGRVSNHPDVVYRGTPSFQPGEQQLLLVILNLKPSMVHIVVSFASSDTLRIGNIADSTIQSSLRTAFGSDWKDSIKRDAYSDTEWVLGFRGRPWHMSGMLAVP